MNSPGVIIGAGSTEMTVPKINVYLPDDLADAVKEAGVPVSAVCQRALETAVRRVTAIRQVVAAAPDAAGAADPPIVNFTARLMGMLQSAKASARAAGVAAGTEHLLSVLADDDNSLAVRVLSALEITPRQIRSALAGPGRAGTEPAARPAAEAKAATEAKAAAGRPGFDQHAALALELAVTESSGLGNNYVGTEHLLLGLIGEPDGTAGSVLRSLGADLRATRRTVAAALAGWGAANAARAQRSGEQSASTETQQQAQFAAVIRSELEPVLARIEQLERQAAS
jgi:ATP-dependent Clp protease ATP-binding subunit ClpC